MFFESFILFTKCQSLCYLPIEKGILSNIKYFWNVEKTVRNCFKKTTSLNDYKDHTEELKERKIEN